MSSVIVGAGEGGLIRKPRWWLNIETGPAHAVYFATYEAVKQAMGGNDRSTHHPLAAGKYSRCPMILFDLRLLTISQQPVGHVQPSLAMHS